jgi:hypothetical protein
MKRLIVLALISTCFSAFGCGEAKSKIDLTYNPSEEEKQKTMAEDKLVADEESHGTAGKVKSKAKGKR